MKVYHIFVMDNWQDVEEIGYYTSLENKSLLEELNSYFEDKIVLDDNEEEIEDFKLKPGNLKEYASSFGSCFDKNIDIKDEGCIRIFGFINDLDTLINGLLDLRK